MLVRERHDPSFLLIGFGPPPPWERGPLLLRRYSLTPYRQCGKVTSIQDERIRTERKES